MSRRQAREIALQTLFSLDFNKTSPDITLRIILKEHGKIAKNSKNYAEILVMGVIKYSNEIDQLINQTSLNWKIERMGSIDRNITRLAIFEMKYSVDKIKPNMVINEAIEVAKVYGSEDSSRFINGILGTLI